MKRNISALILITLATLSAFGSTQTQQPVRYDRFLFGVDYYPEHWDESMWEQDARRMREAGVDVIRIGEFAWALMEPEEGRFDFALFDRAINTFAKYDIKVILGTPTATPPKWLTHKYPEVLHVYINGQAANDQSRRHYCYNSAVYRRLSKRIVERMSEHYRNSPHVIGWQIDNEFNNENPECYSESCRAMFRGWLKNKYGTLNALNQRWGTIFWSQLYTDWEQINLPSTTPAFHNPALILDFKRFISDSVTSYMEEQLSILRKTRPDDFVTQNGVFKNIDYYRMTRNLDLQSTANYPLFTDEPQYSTGTSLTLNRSFSGRFMIMEQQTGPAGQTYLLRVPRPGEMNLWAFQSIAHGADGIVHFRWRSARRGAEEYWYGVLDHDNVPRARFEEFKKEGTEIKRIGAEVFGSKIVSDIAVIYDFEAEWAYDHQYFTREVNVRASLGHLFRAASEMKYNIDFISPDGDFGQYKIVFAPHLLLMSPALSAKIKEFVARGGTFIMAAHSAVKDRDNAMTDQTIPIEGLRDLFGAEVDSFQSYQPPSAAKNALRFTGEGGATLVPVNVFAELLRPRGANVVAVWDKDFMRGLPAATENRSGRGRAVYYGSYFNLDAARLLLSRYTKEHNLKPLFTGFPKDIEVTRRTKRQHDYYFILNHSGESVTLSPGDGYFDLIAGRASAPVFTLKAFEYKVLKK
ncbi:MAG TPA: beta-galactosidase [Pyrinomonadaceae bacterium]|jgi:beta-galactosidase